MNDKNKNSGFDATDIAIFAVAILALIGAAGISVDYFIGRYADFVEWLGGEERGTLFRIARAIFTALSGLLVVFILFTISRIRALERDTAEKKETAWKPEPAYDPREEVRASWEEIRRLANSKSASDWNMAVLRADALIDDVLRRAGYEGPTIADRLKIVDSSSVPSINDLWSAHRVRNMIAHEPLEQHPRETIITALRAYERALKELGMMEERKEGIKESGPAA